MPNDTDTNKDFTMALDNGDDLDSDELENEYEDDEDVPFPEVEKAERVD